MTKLSCNPDSDLRDHVSELTKKLESSTKLVASLEEDLKYAEERMECPDPREHRVNRRAVWRTGFLGGVVVTIIVILLFNAIKHGAT
jgi:vacuolar-type H+-ATPase subunit E/Vma4